ncbi:MAG: acetoacetate decarboxylase family protein [Trueperaceae bacterium]|nr:acetoacetate decarboxylase family protein [Trueperaceae bacterium]
MPKLQRPTLTPAATPCTTSPPWHLTGRGFLLLYDIPRRVGLAANWVPAALQGRYRGGPGAVLLLDYHTSDVGPYRELLFIPGRFDVNGRRYFRITKIYVSTEASVVWGRRNWAIPKQRAEFDFGARHVRVRRGNDTVYEAHFELARWRLPVHAGLVPPVWRTLWQSRAQTEPDEHLLTTPSARGWLGGATNTALRSAADFPDPSQLRPRLTLRLEDVTLYFPVPRRVISSADISTGSPAENPADNPTDDVPTNSAERNEQALRDVYR